MDSGAFTELNTIYSVMTGCLITRRPALLMAFNIICLKLALMCGDDNTSKICDIINNLFI